MSCADHSMQGTGRHLLAKPAHIPPLPLVPESGIEAMYVSLYAASQTWFTPSCLQASPSSGPGLGLGGLPHSQYSAGYHLPSLLSGRASCFCILGPNSS